MTAVPFVVDAASVTGRPADDGALIERAALGAHTDSPGLEQSVLELESGGSCRRATGNAEEVLFVLSGHGTLAAGGELHSLEPEAGAYLGPWTEYQLTVPGDEELLVVSVRATNPDDGPPSGVVVRRLADQPAADATEERWFQIIAEPSSGLRSATQFVGYIPPGHAEEHFHTYDEVIYVLDGAGSFQAAGRSWPVGPGSCIALPARTVHRLQNSGREVLRLLAVFRPAGSPAAAYHPDGTLAYLRDRQSPTLPSGG